jgi:hypothetical protein
VSREHGPILPIRERKNAIGSFVIENWEIENPNAVSEEQPAGMSP